MAVCEEGVSPQFEAIKVGLPGRSSSSSGAETLERELQNLGLEENGAEQLESNTAADKDEKIRNLHFPLRPGEPDCAFYLRTGACKYGPSCKFNHPPGKQNQEKGKEKEKAEEKDKDIWEVPAQQAECKYYLTAGGCKYGKNCRYSHVAGAEESVEYNFLGLPIRLGEKECPFYMRNGSCKFGINCRFHHPDPTAVDSTSGSQNGGSLPLQTSAMLWSMQSTSSDVLTHYLDAPPQPYVSAMRSPPHGMPSNQEWINYQAPVNTLLQHEWNVELPPPSMGASSRKEATEMVDSTYQQERKTVDEFPERPSEPECQYYMKTGNCKYRSACRFHHPKTRPSKLLAYALSPLGLPLRPGQVICTYYSRFGICKYGPSCRFDHPIHGFSSSLAASTSENSTTCPPNEATQNVIQSAV
ncbi:zinc finger CCCH domain-containing protein 43-like [Aristolochia californica]|uniref:zinc finger CCCH domain-containing protein 43-like n=1 Tax=Aristolochia californica TaxID=171875 RepID=UPI0035DAA532